MTTKTHAFAVTEMGRAHRPDGDAYLAADELGCYAVADGRGGPFLPGAALRAVHAAVAAGLGELSGPLSPRALLDLALAAVDRAAEVAYALARMQGPQPAATTTLTLLLVDGASAAMAHVGDSRLYRIRSGGLELLSCDHNVAGEQLRGGHITPQHARVHPLRRVLSRSLGGAPTAVADTVSMEVEPDDVFVLATDGLTELVEEPDVLWAFVVADDPADGLRTLVERADESGARRSGTAVVVRTQSEGSSASAATIELLAQHPLFAGMDLAGRTRVLAAGRTLELEPGEALLDRDSPLCGLWLIVAGSVSWDERRDERDGHVLRYGAWFGEAGLVASCRCPAVVVAREATILFYLPATGLERLSARQPGLGLSVLRGLVRTLATGAIVAAHPATVGGLTSSLPCRRTPVRTGSGTGPA